MIKKIREVLSTVELDKINYLPFVPRSMDLYVIGSEALFFPCIKNDNTGWDLDLTLSPISKNLATAFPRFILGESNSGIALGLGVPNKFDFKLSPENIFLINLAVARLLSMLTSYGLNLNVSVEVNSMITEVIFTII